MTMRFPAEPTIAQSFVEHLCAELGLSEEEVLRLGGQWLMSTEAGQVLRAALLRDSPGADEAA
jgi:hypothetical protein